MSYLEIIDRVLEKQRREKAEPNKADISLLRLSELAKRNMAIEIYSELLGCSFWFCSNELMALQVKDDYPDAVTYTVDEIRELIKLQPSPEELRAINNVKRVFKESKIDKPKVGWKLETDFG